MHTKLREAACSRVVCKTFCAHISPISKAMADKNKCMPYNFSRWKPLNIQAALPGIKKDTAQSFLYQTQLRNSSQSLKLKAL